MGLGFAFLYLGMKQLIIWHWTTLQTHSSLCHGAEQWVPWGRIASLWTEGHCITSAICTLLAAHMSAVVFSPPQQSNPSTSTHRSTLSVGSSFCLSIHPLSIYTFIHICFYKSILSNFPSILLSSHSFSFPLTKMHCSHDQLQFGIWNQVHLSLAGAYNPMEEMAHINSTTLGDDEIREPGTVNELR